MSQLFATTDYTQVPDGAILVTQGRGEYIKGHNIPHAPWIISTVENPVVGVRPITMNDQFPRWCNWNATGMCTDTYFNDFTLIGYYYDTTKSVSNLSNTEDVNESYERAIKVLK